MKSLFLLTPCFAVAASLLAAALPAAAQDRIYRCGNEYTNQVKGRKDCKLVEGGNVTVVRGTMPAAAAPVAAPARAAAPRSSSGGGSSAGASASAAAAPRIDTPEQRARDADARVILEQELRRAESRQAELLKAYNNGEPERQGNERNYQKYLDRVAEMKADIDRNQADIDGIKRELNRLR